MLGLRISETLALKWLDIDEEKESITIQRAFTHSRLKSYPKTDASRRTLPLHKDVLKRLLEWKKISKPESGDAYIFPGAKGTPLSDSTMAKDYIKPAAERAGIPPIAFHPLRHSHTSWLDLTKATPREQKDLLGHAVFATTMDIYGHALTRAMRNANSRVVKAVRAAEQKQSRHR